MEGIMAFIDIKTIPKTVVESYMKQLTHLGAKVAKTFNRKVTHVVFFKGRPETLRVAHERKIPLVSMRWICKCSLGQKFVSFKRFPLRQKDYNKMKSNPKTKPNQQVRKAASVSQVAKPNGKLSNSSQQAASMSQEAKPSGSLSNSSQQCSSILKGVFAYIDVKNNRNTDRLRDVLTQQGAEITKTFNRKVTHLIFYEGRPNTALTAAERGIPIILPDWPFRCERSGRMVDYKDYPPCVLNFVIPFAEKKPKPASSASPKKEKVSKRKIIAMINKIMNDKKKLEEVFDMLKKKLEEDDTDSD